MGGAPVGINLIGKVSSRDDFLTPLANKVLQKIWYPKGSFNLTNLIHSTAIIGPNVSLGYNNYIGPNSVILGNTEIGDENWVGPNVVIGTPPEHRGINTHRFLIDQPVGKVKIGNMNVIRENSVIQMPTGETTAIGNECYLMDGVHLGHDVVIQNNVTVAPKVTFAGHVFVQNGATIGIGVAVHQFRVIGALSMVGMNSSVTMHVKPFSTYAGSPARYIKPNSIGLAKSGIKLRPTFNFHDPVQLWNLNGMDDDSAKLLYEFIFLTKKKC